MSPEARRQQVLTLLQREPLGMNGPAVGARIGVGRVHVGKVLRAMRKLGLVRCLSNGRSARWVLPCNEEAARADLERAQQEARSRERLRQRDRERRRAEPTDEELALDRRIVAASMVRPLRPRGPASVFQLAEFI